MANADYQRYVDETLSLVRSIVIKSEAFANQINQELFYLGYETPNDQRDWRYYQHLAGEYHFLDTPMVIKSLDTLEEITFDRRKLIDHPVTRTFYTRESRFVRELITRYPTQEMLILGILFPIEKEYAIDSPDYTIIDYDKELVEENETNLITLLQQRIFNYYHRWNVPGYHSIDDLFTVAHFGLLCQQLPMMLFNIRLENCHTPYVHGFHIKEFLKSNGRLDRFYDFLTRRQHLFLYRNIRYIRTHAGKQSTFDWIAQRLLTERQIGIAEYRHLHNDDTLEETLQSAPVFLRKGLNQFHRSTRTEEHSLADLLNKENVLAPGNPRVEEATFIDESRRLPFTTRNTYPTKALESSIVDTSTGGYVTLIEVLLNHWVTWSLEGQYTGIIRVNHPQSGSLLELTPVDTVHLYWYCMNRAFGHTPDVKLPIRTQLVRHRTPVTQALLQAKTSYTPRSLVEWFANQPNYTSTYRSPQIIASIGVQIHNDIIRQREAFSLQEDYRVRGEAESLFWTLYRSTDFTLWEEYETLDEWHFEKGFNVDDLSQLEYEEFSTHLFMEATGLSGLDNMTMSDIQRALVTLFSELSSYSVQFLREVNEGPIRYMDRLTLRLGELYGHGKWQERVPLDFFGINNVTTKGTFRHEMPLDTLNDVRTMMQTHHAVEMDINNNLSFQMRGIEHIRVPLNPLRVEVNEL